MKKTVAFLVIFILAGIGCGLTGSKKPNILLISIDTLRADHLRCYGYHRETSPTLDSLAASGIMFSRCQAQAPHTNPAHASIWTGLSVASHGAGTYGGLDHGLDPTLPNIATVLGEEGYITLGMVNVVVLNNDFGFANGFDYYSWHPNGAGRAGETVDEYLRWLDENIGNPNPVFAVLHFYDVHAPYDPPEPFDRSFTPDSAEDSAEWETYRNEWMDYCQHSRPSDDAEPLTEWETSSVDGSLLNPEARDHLINLYDGEIVWVDNQLGRLFAELRSRGLAENTLIILTADHGEEFLEHGGWGHSHALWQEILHVPLIISGPGISEGVVDTVLVGQFDILPTITGYLDIQTLEGLDGVDILDPGARIQRILIPSSRVSPDKCFRWGMEQIEGLVSVITSERKAINNFGSDEPGMMFDIASDPGEQNPLTVDPDMQEALEFYWSTPRTGHPEAIHSEEVRNQLRDLGYIR